MLKNSKLQIFISPNFTNNRLQSYIKDTLDNDLSFKVAIKSPFLLTNYVSILEASKDQDNSIKNNMNNNSSHEISNKIYEDETDEIINLLNSSTNIKSKNNEYKSNIYNNTSNNININSNNNSTKQIIDDSNIVAIENPDSKENPYLLVIFDEFSLKEILLKFGEITKLSNQLYLILRLNLTNKNSTNILNLKFFLEVNYKVKVWICESYDTMVDFFNNLLTNIPIKKEKSKLEYYENKSTLKLNTYFNEEFDDESTPTWIKHLMCIPGISEIKAHAIAMKYSFKELIKIYLSNEHNKSFKESVLKNIEVNYNGGVKKIGDAISKKVYIFFTSPGTDLIN